MAGDLGEALGRAIDSGDFNAVAPLVEEYATTVRAELAVATTATERGGILKNALQTVNQHLCLVRAMRSHICTRLQAIAGQSIYHTPERETYTWHMDA